MMARFLRKISGYQVCLTDCGCVVSFEVRALKRLAGAPGVVMMNYAPCHLQNVDRGVSGELLNSHSVNMTALRSERVSRCRMAVLAQHCSKAFTRLMGSDLPGGCTAMPSIGLILATFRVYFCFYFCCWSCCRWRKSPGCSRKTHARASQNCSLRV